MNPARTPVGSSATPRVRGPNARLGIRRRASLAAWVGLVASAAFAAAADTELAASITRGEVGYLAHCTICHGVTGLGVKGTYPPLAGSDWLAANREGAIQAVVGGLKGEIRVLGETYSGQMPAIIIDDQAVADTLTYVFNQSANPGGRVTVEEVKAARQRTSFRTFEALKAAGDFRPLPKAPEGFILSELARLPDFATRLASDGKGKKLFVLGLTGTVWRFDLVSGSFKTLFTPKDLALENAKEVQALGMTLDPQGRLLVTVNRRVDELPLVQNEVTIFRTSAFDSENDPVAPQPWFRTRYPQGIGGYNHGVSHLAFGPDGMLYVASGARTDGGETGSLPNYGKMGEVDLTACIWRLDPKAVEPKVEVIARGIRNAFTFAWDDKGNLFTVSNGPNAHAPEEMDYIVPPQPGAAPRHHGFPYQFGDVPATRKWYPHTPEPLPGVEFVKPVVNLGPAGRLGDEPMSTFTPHSSPVGLVWLGNEWPASVRNSFLLGRFGNMIPGADRNDAGFDMLSLRMERQPDGSWAVRTTTFLQPLARPIDIHLAGPGRLFILEYTRVTDFKSRIGQLPGRILELKVAPASR
ncbi:MAG: c-type cytochrome [Opitutaceae bacterium]